MPKVIRTLSWFDKRTEEWMGDARLRGARMPELRRLFGARGNDPMYESYPVGKHHVATVRKWVDVPILLSKYDYFVECSAVQSASAAMSATR